MILVSDKPTVLTGVLGRAAAAGHSTSSGKAAPRGGIDVVDPAVEPDWDRQLAYHADASIFHSAAWCRVLQESYDYRPFYIINRGPDRSLSSIIPMIEIESVLGRRAVSLPFTDRCSILSQAGERSRFVCDLAALKGSRAVFLPANEGETECGQLLKLSRQRGWKSFECRDGGAELPACEIHYEHVLDLSQGEEKIFQGMGESTRRAIRRAEKNQLSVRMEQSFEATERYYRLHCLTRRVHGVPPQPLHFFENLHRHILSRGLGFIVMAYHGDAPMAAGVFLHFGRTAVYKFGASDPEQSNLRGNNAAMWQAIRFLSNAGFETLSFGRSSKDNPGLRRFKLGWGATERELSYSRFSFQKAAFAKLQGTPPAWRRELFRRFPLPLARLVGSVLYRYAG